MPSKSPRNTIPNSNKSPNYISSNESKVTPTKEDHDVLKKAKLAASKRVKNTVNTKKSNRLLLLPKSQVSEGNSLR